MPIDRIVVTTAGSPVGMAEMANAMAAVNTTLNSLPRARLSTIETSSAMPAIDEDLVGQLVELAGQRRLASSSGLQHAGDVADLGGHAGRGDDELARRRG